VDVTLFSKPGCHLCEEARALLLAAAKTRNLRVCEQDITQDASTFARYQFSIPVVQAGKRELGWPFSEAKLTEWLANGG
jgi:hypothetical protein